MLRESLEETVRRSQLYIKVKLEEDALFHVQNFLGRVYLIAYEHVVFEERRVDLFVLCSDQHRSQGHELDLPCLDLARAEVPIDDIYRQE